jgi:Spy/CpxP family protein refolding chaperone
MKHGEDTMNKLMIATTLALGLATGFAVAQPSTGERAERTDRAERFERMLDRRVERMTAELNLTQAQALQVRTIFAEQGAARRALHQRHREESMALHSEGQVKLSDVLNTEQKAKLESLMAERREAWQGKRGGHRKGHGHGHRGGMRRAAPPQE